MAKKGVGNAYKKYTKEFRRDAVHMIQTEGLTTAEVGRRLEVNANLLRKWRQTHGKKSETQVAQSDLEAELRRLRGGNRLSGEEISQFSRKLAFWWFQISCRKGNGEAEATAVSGLGVASEWDSNPHKLPLGQVRPAS